MSASKQFLMYGGILLLVLAILGFVNFHIGTTLYFDSAENWAHLVLGVVAIAAAMWASADIQKYLTILVGLIALYFGVYGLFILNGIAPNYYGVANLEFIDDILHLAVAVWALWAGFMGKTATA